VHVLLHLGLADTELASQVLGHVREIMDSISKRGN